MNRKPAAIVLSNLGDVAQTISWARAIRQLDVSPILLTVTPPGTETDATPAPLPFDLQLSVRDAQLSTLRATISQLSERYTIAAVIPTGDTTSDAIDLGFAASQLTDALALPGFGASAFAISANRYLTRCHFQRADLPVTDFSLVQFSSALPAAGAMIGLPVRLSPIHYGLRHLTSRISRESEACSAYHLISNTLQRHALTHPGMRFDNGTDPRTHHHIRFSWMSDMLVAADPAGTTVETVVHVRQGVPQALACAPIAQRGRRTATLTRKAILWNSELSVEACKAVSIQSGIATCITQHSPEGTYLDGIIPNGVDNRFIPAIESGQKQTWAEFILRTFLKP